MKHTAPAFLVLLLLLVAVPLTAQPPPPPPNSLWIAGGGAVGETAQIAIASHYAGFDDYVLAWSPALRPTAQVPQLAAPFFLLGGGTIPTTRVAVYPVTLPNDPKLVGTTVHLQGAFWSGTSSLSTAVLTWVFAPASGRQFVMSSPTRPFAVSPGDGHARATLADGTVLLSGGLEPTLPGLRFRSVAYVYDPARSVLRTTTVMNSGRGGHVMRRLGNAEVLIVGGDQNDQAPTAELYSPVTGKFSTLAVPGFLQDPTASVIREPGTGREFVLVAGGRATRNGAPSSDAYLYDVANARFILLPGLAHARVHAGSVALAAGTVLITGGIGPNATVRDDAELFVLATRRFYPWGRMTRARYGHVMLALDPLHALVIAGSDGNSAQRDLELFAGLTLQSTRLPHRLHLGRVRFTAAVLADGSILVAGGFEDRLAYPGRTPEVIGAAGVTPLRPIQAMQPDVALQPLAGGGAMAFDFSSVHLLK